MGKGKGCAVFYLLIALGAVLMSVCSAVIDNMGSNPSNDPAKQCVEDSDYMLTLEQCRDPEKALEDILNSP